MPIIKPNENERQSEFISRCMGDDTMNSEYPDRAQRFAICKSQFSRAKLENEEKEQNLNESVADFIRSI